MTPTADIPPGEFDSPILIAGFGSIGRRHWQNLKTLGYGNLILYRTGQGTITADEDQNLTTVTDLDRGLAMQPRAVVICNPTAKHLPVALATARAGCDLFIEKPVSSSLEGCAELLDLAQRQNLVTMIGCQFRFHPLLQSLREQLRQGRLGEVFGARVEWGEYLPTWHPWEDHRQSYSARADLGGGVILTLIHPIDYLLWLFGPVRRVQASVRAVACLQTSVADDSAEITLDFASGPIGQIHLDYVQQPPIHRLVVLGELGRATWDYHAGTLLWEPAAGQAELVRVPDGFERNTMFIDEMRHFLNCVRRRQPTSVPLEDGIAALDVALQAKRVATEECPSG